MRAVGVLNELDELLWANISNELPDLRGYYSGMSLEEFADVSERVVLLELETEKSGVWVTRIPVHTLITKTDEEIFDLIIEDGLLEKDPVKSASLETERKIIKRIEAGLVILRERVDTRIEKPGYKRKYLTEDVAIFDTGKEEGIIILEEDDLENSPEEVFYAWASVASQMELTAETH